MLRVMTAFFLSSFVLRFGNALRFSAVLTVRMLYFVGFSPFFRFSLRLLLTSLSSGDYGPAGEPGERGEYGNTTGVAEKGPRGPDGVKGQPGLNQPRGRMGSPGRKGEPGYCSRCADGQKGDPGKDGFAGPRGVDGRNGSDGQKGFEGGKGVDGPPGKDGVKGLPVRSPDKPLASSRLPSIFVPVFSSPDAHPIPLLSLSLSPFEISSDHSVVCVKLNKSVKVLSLINSNLQLITHCQNAAKSNYLKNK